MVSLPRAQTESLPGVGEPGALPEPANGIEDRLDQLAREVHESTQQIRELVRLSDTEQLMSLLNPRAFLREATRICLMARRHKFPLSLLYVNLDDFKSINRVWGRRGGDAVLDQVANHLARLLRGSDMIGRVGADEFCGLMSHSTVETAGSKGRALVQLLRDEPPVYLGRPVEVHVTYAALDCDGRIISDAMDAAVADILQQRQHRLP